MRQIALDTETTGMDIQAGNRVIEIGCVEICERVASGRTFHVYLNPDRDSEPGALQVHSPNSGNSCPSASGWRESIAPARCRCTD